MAAMNHNTVIGLTLSDSTSMCIEFAPYTLNAAKYARLTHMRALLSPHTQSGLPNFSLLYGMVFYAADSGTVCGV